MPLELVGKEGDQVARIRPQTPLENALDDARVFGGGLGELWPFAPHFLELDGAFLHFVDEGPRDAPVILCVHGNPTWSFQWREVLTRMRGRYRVVALDHMGMGLSERPHDWSDTLAAHQAGLEALIEHLDLRDITLVVHDWGGPIGLGVAARQPERFRRFLITNTCVWPEAQLPAALALGRLPFLGPFLTGGLGLMNRLLASTTTTKGLSPEVAEGYLAPYRTAGRRRTVASFVRAIPRGPGHENHEALAAVDAALPALRTKPTTLVWGMQDWVFTPAILRGWRERMPRAEVRALEGAGHLVMEDAGAEVLDALRDLLDRD
ncbi:MAG: alpha/beta fold hydrolase [Planctomycetes bacterium]|nr:alpha/beta fold hydrolase [Planctomycetota bacterium]